MYAVKAFLFVSIYVIGLTGFTGEIPIAITWTNLNLQVSLSDPLRGLSPTQSRDFRSVGRLRAMEIRVPEQISPGIRVRAEKARERLAAEGIDADALFDAHLAYQNERLDRKTRVNPDLDGQSVRISGYALPLRHRGKAVTEFLLVPWIGACIHTPPPPPNQIVLVTLEKPRRFYSRFSAVTVEGLLTLGQRAPNLFLTDGSADIPVSYSVAAAEVSRFDKRRDVMARSIHQPETQTCPKTGKQIPLLSDPDGSL